MLGFETGRRCHHRFDNRRKRRFPRVLGFAKPPPGPGVLIATWEPLDAADAAGRLGLRVSTARFHLDKRTPGLSGPAPGRKTAGPATHAPLPDRTDPQRKSCAQLIHVHSAALAHEDGRVRARSAPPTSGARASAYFRRTRTDLVACDWPVMCPCPLAGR